VRPAISSCGATESMALRPYAEPKVKQSSCILSSKAWPYFVSKNLPQSTWIWPSTESCKYLK
jgi:hypothetical protein